MAVAVALSVLRTADRAAVLLDATRQRLVAHLAQPDSAAGLARRLKLPRQRINYHLRALERAGLVELVEERRKGNCMERLLRATARAFVISPEALGSLGASPETTPDRMSAEYLISAAARALREVAMLDAGARKAGKRLATFTLDTEIRFPNAAARAAFAAALTHAVADLAAKYHDERAPGGRRFRVLAAVHPVPTGRKDHDQHD